VKQKMALAVITLFFLSIHSNVALAQTTDADKTVAAGDAVIPGTSDDSGVEKHHRRPVVKKENYATSRYTSDKSEAEADHRKLLMAVGVDKVIDLDSNFNFSNQTGAIMTGNTQVLNVAPVTIGTQKQLIIKPTAEGETNITVRDKTGKIKVVFDVIVAKLNLVRLLERLKTSLKEVEGIDIDIEDQKIVIRGDVLSPNDYGTIVNELGDKQYGDTVLNKATMSPITLGALAKKIESDVQIFAPTVRASVLNGKIILDGSVESEAIKTRCLRRAEWYLPSVRISDPIAFANNAEKSDRTPQVIQSDIQVTPPPAKRESKLVRMSVYFVELSKDFVKSFGFKWQPGFTADPSISIGSTQTGGTATGNAGGGFSFAGTLSSLFPALNAPPSNASYGRILKTSTVVVKSGEAAKVTDTQQIPISSTGINGQVDNSKTVDVGFDTSITPTILQGQDVDVNIDLTQKSQIGKGAGGAPILDNHHVISRLYLKSGEVGAVAAVNKQDVTTSFNRDDPNATTASAPSNPLFTLQRSKNFSKDKGQFVIFVSPQIIESASEGTEDLKKNFRMPSSNH
jgi:pilus assembly protein CpaC